MYIAEAPFDQGNISLNGVIRKTQRECLGRSSVAFAKFLWQKSVDRLQAVIDFMIKIIMGNPLFPTCLYRYIYYIPSCAAYLVPFKIFGNII